MGFKSVIAHPSATYKIMNDWLTIFSRIRGYSIDFWSNLTALFQSISIPIGETSVSLGGILQFIFYSIIIIILIVYIRRFLRLRVLQRLILDQGVREVFANLLSYGLGMFFLIILLQTSGFNLSALAVIVGGLGVGIGFGLQDLTKNFASGLTLITERKIKVGDLVEFDSLIGFVREISTRSTLIRTFDGAEVVVPNSQLVENRILNWSYENLTGRIHLPIGVAYESDRVVVTETLLMAAYLDPNVLDDPPPQVQFIGFGESSLNFELLVWISPMTQFPKIKSSLYFLVDYHLRQHNIEIPYSQVDVRLRNPESLFPLTAHTNADVPVTVSEGALAKSAITPTTIFSIRDLLQNIPYFSLFNEVELRQLIELGYCKSYKSSTIVFNENEPGNAFYIILSGSVEVFVARISKHLKTLKAGDFLGELSLMLNIPRTATVKTLENTVFFVINQQNFADFLQKNPALAELIILELAKHQEELKERQKELREKGLISDDEDDSNLILWVRKRIKNLFNLNNLDAN
jgi:small-conductance mechanosensitive channel